MDCLRLDLPLSGSTETDTCEDYSISIPKVKNEENLFLWYINLFRSVCSILPIIIYAKANIYIYTWSFRNIPATKSVCYRVSRNLIKTLVFRFPLACSRKFHTYVFASYTKQSTVCSELFVRIFYATCVFSIGAGVFGLSMTIFKVRKHSGKVVEGRSGWTWALRSQKKLVLKNEVSS